MGAQPARSHALPKYECQNSHISFTFEKVAMRGTKLRPINPVIDVNMNISCNEFFFKLPLKEQKPTPLLLITNKLLPVH